MTGTEAYADWIAVDWGTSNVRAWAMTDAGEVRAEAKSDQGMGKLTREAFEPALLDLVGDWLGAGPIDIVACGMVGSRQGWVEAPYRTVPCAVEPGPFATPDVRDSRLNVRVIPGVRQMSPADVMRGEETQIAGFLAENPDFDGVLCLPGTHTKWVRLSAREIVGFRTAMTGELFALLSTRSVLAHSMGDGWDAAAFEDSLSDTISKPETLAQRLFTIRADSLLHGASGATARARLSGLLIGAELAASKPYWLGSDIVLIGAERLSELYRTALATQGAPARIVDGDQQTRRGLIAAHAALKETTP